MFNLKYKTRGNSPLKGKPKLYFCCHPKDFDKCFEKISNEILSIQNCAVLYAEKDTMRDDEFFAELKETQLFVMPVTSNLLFGDSYTLDVEFRFAIENHIPVLPLMQENGLDETFNKKCGNIQFLNKYNDDSTALSYDEKLRKYLAAILIGDELAKKVRAAFDAYVFLSYRKKDRKYAQELMRLIHKNEFCRDIAIWYDEFLTPGENFNDSIKEALQKSGLFLLTVTPNLVNETNYVMTTEYPMAKQEGKHILPAELVPTDREQLSEKYADIPHPTDAHNDAELSGALLESIKKMAIKENDDSPEHNFFIGLAYLGGIDVEIDYERAVRLITSAAEEGLVEAINKLIHMYEYGEGVSFDSDVAMKWRKELIEILDEKYEETPSKENALILLDTLRDCYDVALANGEISNLSEAADKYFSKSSDLKQNELLTDCDEELEFAELDSYLKLAYISELQGDSNEAGTSYNVLTTSIEDYVEEYKTQRGIRLLGICLQRLGGIYKKADSYKDAMENLKKATHHFEKLAKLGDEHKPHLIECYVDLSDMENARERFGEALIWSRKALDVIEELATLNPSVGYEYDMCKATLNMGTSYWGERNRSEAIRCYKNAVSYAEKIVYRCPTERNIHQLACAYKSFGKMFDEDNNLGGAIAWYKKCISKYSSILNDESTDDEKRELADTFRLMAKASKRSEDINNAKKYLLKELDIRKQIVETGVEISTEWDTLIKVTNGELSTDEAIDKPNSTVVTKPEDSENLSDCYMELGDCFDVENELAISVENYNECLRVRKELFEEYSTTYTALLLQEIYDKLGSVYKKQKKINSAIECYKEVALLLEVIITEDTECDYRKQLLYCYLEIGELLEMEGLLDKAIAHYEKSMAYCESNYSKEDTRDDIVYMLQVTHYFCYSAAMIQFKRKRCKDAKGWIDKAVDLLERSYNKTEAYQREQLQKAYSLAIDIAWKIFDIKSLIKYKRKLKNMTHSK